MSNLHKISMYGKELEIQVQSTPIFQFKCPACEKIVYEGIVDFDMENEETCEECGWEDEIWMFPHTILGSNLWTIGGHYSNDPLSHLPLKDTVHYFLWLIADDQKMVHGRSPYHLGTYEECVEKLREAGLMKKWR